MRKKLFNLSRLFATFSILLIPFGVFVSPVSADALTGVSDTLEDSRPSQDSNHTITFTTASLVDDNGTDTITVTFPASFDLTGLTEDDIDLEDDTVDKTTAANCSTTEHFSVEISGQVITFTACSADSGDIAIGSDVVIKIGDHAADSGTGTNKINNHPTAAVYDVTIAGTFGDTGLAKIVVIDTITASVSVAETLTFTITGQAPAACADYDNTAGTEVTTTATTIPFGTVSANAFNDGCLELDVDTNAANGYTVTVTESDQLTFGGDQIGDGTCDGGCSEITEADWATATNNGFGYCVQDFTGNGGTTADAGWGTNGCDAADTFFKVMPELNVDTPEAQSIMSSVDGVNDVSDIGFRLSVAGTQAAGTYTNNVIFVATPTF